MGEVYRATDSVLERKVAVKLLSERLRAQDGRAARASGERRSPPRGSRRARTSSPSSTSASTDGRPFIVMEYLEGGSVYDRLRSTRGSRAQALAWLAQAPAALDRAHAQGIVHRDVKPANLLLDHDGNVHVSDFGIASTPGFDTLTASRHGPRDGRVPLSRAGARRVRDGRERPLRARRGRVRAAHRPPPVRGRHGCDRGVRARDRRRSRARRSSTRAPARRRRRPRVGAREGSAARPESARRARPPTAGAFDARDPRRLRTSSTAACSRTRRLAPTDSRATAAAAPRRTRPARLLGAGLAARGPRRRSETSSRIARSTRVRRRRRRVRRRVDVDRRRDDDRADDGDDRCPSERLALNDAGLRPHAGRATTTGALPLLERAVPPSPATAPIDRGVRELQPRLHAVRRSAAATASLGLLDRSEAIQGGAEIDAPHVADAALRRRSRRSSAATAPAREMEEGQRQEVDDD